MSENQSNDLQGKNWYVVKTYSNENNASHEEKVVEAINQRKKSYNLENNIFRVVYAKEVIEPKQDPNSTKKPKKPKVINLYPGFVFVEMIMSDEAWFVVRNTPGVMGIEGSAGGGTKPVPVPPSEMESVLKRIGEIDDAIISRYNIGDKVNIIDGPFANTEGIITNIGEDSTVTVEVELAGSKLPLEFQFKDIEKKDSEKA